MKDYPPSALEHKPLKWTEHEWLTRFLDGGDPVSPGLVPASPLAEGPSMLALQEWVLTLRLWGRETWVQASLACLRHALGHWNEALKLHLASPLLDAIADKERPGPKAQLTAVLEWTHKAGERKLEAAERLLTEDPELSVPTEGADPRQATFAHTVCIGNHLLRTVLSFQGQCFTAMAALHLARIEQAWGRSPEASCQLVQQVISDALRDWMERKPPLQERENWMLKYMKPRFSDAGDDED